MGSDEQRIGWCEYIALPDWGIHQLRAKADTGAKSSSLHVEDICEQSGGRLSFVVVLDRRHNARIKVIAKQSRVARVTSSNGQTELRLFVKTSLRLGPIERQIELNLVDRRLMVHRMLLGRTALSGLVVDVSKRYVMGKKRNAARKGTTR